MSPLRAAGRREASLGERSVLGCPFGSRSGCRAGSGAPWVRRRPMASIATGDHGVGAGGQGPVAPGRAAVVPQPTRALAQGLTEAQVRHVLAELPYQRSRQSLLTCRCVIRQTASPRNGSWMSSRRSQRMRRRRKSRAARRQSARRPGGRCPGRCRGVGRVRRSPGGCRVREGVGGTCRGRRRGGEERVRAVSGSADHPGDRRDPVEQGQRSASAPVRAATARRATTVHPTRSTAATVSSHAETSEQTSRQSHDQQLLLEPVSGRLRKSFGG